MGVMVKMRNVEGGRGGSGKPFYPILASRVDMWL